MEEIDLADQQDTLSKDLSGGQKRKLCVGLALIGDPKVQICREMLENIPKKIRTLIVYEHNYHKLLMYQ